MASKFGGAQSPGGGSGTPRAVQLGHWLEATPTAVGIPQSNPRRSNPPGGAARSRSAPRLWGMALGAIPHDALTTQRQGGQPASSARSNVGEAPAPWLRGAPRAGGDWRTRDMRRVTMSQGNNLVNGVVILADSETAVLRLFITSRVQGAFRGKLHSVSRVRASASVRHNSSIADDDLVGGYGRRARFHAFREEGGNVPRRGGPAIVCTRQPRCCDPNPRNGALARAAAVSHRSHRGLASVHTYASSKREARIGHQAARPSGFSNSQAGMPVKASSLTASSGEGL